MFPTLEIEIQKPCKLNYIIGTNNLGEFQLKKVDI